MSIVELGIHTQTGIRENFTQSDDIPEKHLDLIHFPKCKTEDATVFSFTGERTTARTQTQTHSYTHMESIVVVDY